MRRTVGGAVGLEGSRRVDEDLHVPRLGGRGARTLSRRRPPPPRRSPIATRPTSSAIVPLERSRSRTRPILRGDVRASREPRRRELVVSDNCVRCLVAIVRACVRAGRARSESRGPRLPALTAPRRNRGDPSRCSPARHCAGGWPSRPRTGRDRSPRRPRAPRRCSARARALPPRRPVVVGRHAAWSIVDLVEGAVAFGTVVFTASSPPQDPMFASPYTGRGHSHGARSSFRPCRDRRHRAVCLRRRGGTIQWWRSAIPKIRLAVKCPTICVVTCLADQKRRWQRSPRVTGRQQILEVEPAREHRECAVARRAAKRRAGGPSRARRRSGRGRAGRAPR